MNWSSMDFLIFGALVLLVWGSFYVIKRLVKKSSHRRVLFVILAILALLLWAEMGVGIFGTSLAGD